MISDIIRAFIDKYGKIRDRLINAAYVDKTNINIKVPNLRTLLKSSSINAFFENIYKSILLLYAYVEYRGIDFGAKHKVLKKKINAINNRLTYLENNLNFDISYIGKVINIDYNFFNNCRLTDSVMLKSYKSVNITADDISNIEFESYPYTEELYTSPVDGDLTNILFDTNSSGLHVEKTIYTNTSSSFILSNQEYTGMLGKITITFTNLKSISNVYMKLLPGIYSVLQIVAYDESDNVSATIYPSVDIKNGIFDYIMESPLSSIKKLEIYIQNPYPSISKNENNVDINELQTIVENIPLIVTNKQAIVNTLNRIDNSNIDYKYKYSIGIYYIRLSNITYIDEGSAASNLIDMKYYSLPSIAIKTNEYKPDNTYIYHIIETDIANYYVNPLTINGEYADPQEFDDTYDVINPEGGIAQISNIQNERIFTFDSYKNMFDLGTVPILVSDVYMELSNSIVHYTRVTSMNELYSDEPRYYISNSVIITNQKYQGKYLTVRAIMGPRYIRIRSVLKTNNTLVTPKLYNTNAYIVNGPTIGASDV